MLILKKDDIEKIYNMEDAIYSAEKAIKTDAEIPLRINFDIPKKNGQALYMPACIKEKGITGLKIVSVYPDNQKRNKPVVPAQMILLDSETGEVAAIIDGTYLTQLRTAAIQGYATKLLSREDSNTALIIGTGGQSIYQIEAMIRVREIDKLYIFDIDYEKAKKTSKLAEEKFNDFKTKFIAIEKLDNIYDEIDILTTVTTSKKPTFDGEKVKDGIHVNGVGAYTEDMIEVPKEYLNRVETVFMDSEDGVLSEAGDVLEAIESGDIDKKSCKELKDLANDKTKGRESSKENTFFKTVGTAVLDLVTAWDIYQRALKENVGTEVEI